VTSPVLVEGPSPWIVILWCCWPKYLKCIIIVRQYPKSWGVDGACVPVQCPTTGDTTDLKPFVTSCMNYMYSHVMVVQIRPTVLTLTVAMNTVIFAEYCKTRNFGGSVDYIILVPLIFTFLLAKLNKTLK